MKEVHEKKMVFAIVYWQDLIQNKRSMELSTRITNKKSSVINNSKQKLLTFKLANCTAVRWFSQKLLPSAFTVVTNGSAFFMLGGGGGETGSFFTGFSSTFLTSSFSSGISSGFLSCFTGSFEFFSDSVFSSLSSSFCLSFFLSFFFSSFSLSLSLSLSLCCNLFRSYLGKYITNKYFKKTVIFKTCFGYNYHCHKKTWQTFFYIPVSFHLSFYHPACLSSGVHPFSCRLSFYPYHPSYASCDHLFCGGNPCHNPCPYCFDPGLCDSIQLALFYNLEGKEGFPLFW